MGDTFLDDFAEEGDIENEEITGSAAASKLPVTSSTEKTLVQSPLHKKHTTAKEQYCTNLLDFECYPGEAQSFATFDRQEAVPRRRDPEGG